MNIAIDRWECGGGVIQITHGRYDNMHRVLWLPRKDLDRDGSGSAIKKVKERSRYPRS